MMLLLVRRYNMSAGLILGLRQANERIQPLGGYLQ